jgi:hypothetical protein
MFDDPSFDQARCQCNQVMDYLRRHGPFEPHRLSLDEMEYTTMPSVAERLAGRWEVAEISVPVLFWAQPDRSARGQLLALDQGHMIGRWAGGSSRLSPTSGELVDG